MTSSGEPVVTAVADTSSDLNRKNSDEFLHDLSKIVVMLLNPYRKERIQGYIVCHDDFKHLARKVSFFPITLSNKKNLLFSADA